MTTANRDIAQRARQIAGGSDGLRRRAALCCAVAAGTTGTLKNAREALQIVPHGDLRNAAITLLTELAGESARSAWTDLPDGSTE